MDRLQHKWSTTCLFAFTSFKQTVTPNKPEIVPRIKYSQISSDLILSSLIERKLRECPTRGLREVLKHSTITLELWIRTHNEKTSILLLLGEYII